MSQEEPSKGALVMIAGGGTAGHVVPGLAIAEALVKRGLDPKEIVFVGALADAGQPLVEQAGHRFEGLPGRGIERKVTLDSLSRNLRAASGLGAALPRARKLLAKYQPRVVVSLGGWASAAVSVAAGLKGIPLVLVCVDAVPGAAQRSVRRFATASAVAYEGVDLPKASLTGVPLREALVRQARLRRDPQLASAARREARVALQLPEDGFVLGVFGGSLGSARINQALAGMVDSWNGEPLGVYHVTGRRDWSQSFAKPSNPPEQVTYRCVAYEDRMELLYHASDLVVCRAGAMTLAEVAAFGLGAIVVPLPNSPKDHQEHNANKMAQAGGAVVIRDVDCTPVKLRQEVVQLMEEPERVAAMAKANMALGALEGAEKVADLVMSTGRLSVKADSSVGLEGTALHIMGAGGAGMSGIATIASSMGAKVSGCDVRASSRTQRLEEQGIAVSIGHSPSHLEKVDALAVSSAVRQSNPEVQAAMAAGVPVWSRAKVLSLIARQKLTIAVAGTHGKTTTTSMLSLIMTEAGMAPSWLIGGEPNDPSGAAFWDASGKWFVVEADESDGTFLDLAPSVAIVTNVEIDHLDHYQTEERLTEAFASFACSASRMAVLCAEDPGASLIAQRLEQRARGFGVPVVLRYGFGEDPESRLDCRAVDLMSGPEASTFSIEYRGQSIGSCEMPLPGKHNVLNALAAACVALELGAEGESVLKAIARFTGVARRFEPRGEVKGIRFVDDYAHLPGEVRAVLETARLGNPGRVVCVFQPHRYSRTALLAEELGKALSSCDFLVVTDVYGAGEDPVPGVTGELVARAAQVVHEDASQGDLSVVYLPERQSLVEFLVQELKPGDLCLTLGAGDLTSLPSELVEALS
jgi:UDP-N-acetylmuramate--alanine ligase